MLTQSTHEISAMFDPAYSAEPSHSTTVLLREITDPEKAKSLFNGRRSPGAIANSKFDSGDHWQNGNAWIGAMPLPGTQAFGTTKLQIQKGLVSENVIKEVVDRHIAGILGREPLWGFLPFDAPNPQAETRRKLFNKLFNIVRSAVNRSTKSGTEKAAQEADEALTSAWWNTRKVRDTLKRAVRTALLEERATVRFFFPNGMRNEQGQIELKSDLPSASTIPQIDVLTCDKAGVFTDSETQQEFGLYIYKTSEDKTAANLTFVQDGTTYLRVMVEKEEAKTYSFELGGRLLMYEITRDALVTEQIRSLQKSLNLGRTMMVRNVNLAGSLERTILNAERPVDADGNPASSLPVGAGVTNFLTGMLVRNDAGEIIARANPNVSFRDPVSTKTFTETRDDLYAAILSGCQQKHALISGDATVSGRSREQARGEYESSLKDTKDAVDDLGRWLLETELRLGALFCNRSREFLELRCDFNSIIETGPISPEDREANRADVQARLMSPETAMSRNGIDDTDAELERIDEGIQKNPPIDLNKNPRGEERPIA